MIIKYMIIYHDKLLPSKYFTTLKTLATDPEPVFLTLFSFAKPEWITTVWL